MLGTLLNGSLGLLGLWADCKVGKSNSVVFLLSLYVLKKSVCMQSLHSQHPHKSVHAALLVMYKNHPGFVHTVADAILFKIIKY